MPIYEYACSNCDYVLDALQKISEDPLVDCPGCGKPELKRLISAPRFRLKGDGWYETDFKKDRQRNLSKGDGDGSAGSGKDAAADSPSVSDKNVTKTVEKASDSKASPKKAVESKPGAGKSE